MSKFVTLHGFGGSLGEESLNFKLKAYSSEEELLADNPVNNTIGIITNIPISGYYFSATEPDNMSEGEVWIKTMPNTSIVEMDVADNIKVYPTYLKQYVGSVWEAKDAQTYKDGIWNKWWDGTLYYAGDTYDHITGGWAKVTGNEMGSITNTDNYITFKKTSTDSNRKMGAAYIVNKIDLTNVESITLEASSNTTSNRPKFVIRADGSNAVLLSIQSTTPQTYTIDTSTLTGKYELWTRIDFSETATFIIYIYRLKLNFA